MTATQHDVSSPRSLAPGGKHGPYNDNNPWDDKDPYCICFYYAVPGAGGIYDVTAYYHDDGAAVAKQDLDDLVKALVQNARSGGIMPRARGKNFDAYPWRRVSWIVLVLDSSDSFATGNAVDIEWDTTTSDRSNHNFFHGGEKRLRIGGSSVAMFWVKNYMRDCNGDELVSTQETFRFHFRSSRVPPLAGYPDESGTNMGPVIGPP